MALAAAAAALSLLAAPPVSNGNGAGAFCLPPTGSFSFRVGVVSTQAIVPNASGFVYHALFYTDRTQGLSRTDAFVEEHDTANSIRYTDDKKATAWTVYYYTGKPTCVKSAYTPLPPGSDCYAADVTPVRKGTQGGVPMQWWTSSQPTANDTFVSACNPVCEKTFASLVRGFDEVRLRNAKETVYSSREFEDFSTAAIPASVFTLPPECPQ